MRLFYKMVSGWEKKGRDSSTGLALCRRISAMAMSAANIGMMDGAYFVGRNEILTWINATLQLSLSRVEEVSRGLLLICVFFFLLVSMAVDS